jgi:hypothetical protein
MLAAPFLLVQGGRALGLLELRSSHAAPPIVGADPAPVSPAPTQVTPLQARALEWSREHASATPARSPLRVLDAPPPPPLPAAFDPGATEVRAEAVLDTLHVNSIMGHGVAGIAVINSRMVRQGDEVVPGWRVHEIDARERSVRLDGPEGRTFTLSLSSP